MHHGWIRLHRRIRDHALWPTDRPYSKLEAWLDLLLSANHKATSVNIDFNVITVQRGQFITSQVKLAKRWGWHRETVSKFLRLTKSEGMTSIETSNKTSSGYTLITIQNYEKYQGAEDDGTDSQTDNRADGQTSSQTTAKRQPSGTNKNDKNEKNIYSAIDSHFEAGWNLYPKRLGNNPKKAARKAFGATVHRGADPRDIIAGTQRYADYVKATGKEGTEFVLQARTFFGPDEPWRQDWSFPAERAQQTNGGFVG